PDKLRWMNGHYIRETSDDRLTELLVEALSKEGLDGEHSTVAATVPLVKTRMHTLKEGVQLLRFLFTDETPPDDKARKMLGPERAEYLREVASRLEAVEEWKAEEIEQVLR